jgi:hypothetical protein
MMIILYPIWPCAPTLYQLAWIYTPLLLTVM